MTTTHEIRFPLPDDWHAKQGICGKGCGAAIVWIKTKAGKFMPLSLASVRDEPDGTKTCASHFADCPEADRFRRRTR